MITVAFFKKRYIFQVSPARYSSWKLIPQNIFHALVLKVLNLGCKFYHTEFLRPKKPFELQSYAKMHWSD